MAAVSDWQEKAKKWLSENGREVDYTFQEAGNVTRLDVKGPIGSFYVLPPEKPGELWTVWSDNGNDVEKISPHLDYLTDSNRSIIEILAKTVELLNVTNESPANDDSSSDAASDDNDDDDDDDGGYYNIEQDDEDDVVNIKPSDDKEEGGGISADDFFTGQGSPGAVHRLLSDLKSMNKSAGKFGITGSPRGDNLFIWDVQLSDFDPKSLLYKDLENYARITNRKPVVALEMKFPHDYPMHPPFVRVLRPRFRFLTGHVTIGGSICMQMLTRSGWSPSNDIESILIQVRAEIMSDQNARLEANHAHDYSESEAHIAFERMVHKYGWNK